MRPDSPDDESISTAAGSDDEYGGNDKTSPRTVVSVSIPLSEFLKLFYSTTTDPDAAAGSEHAPHLTRDTLTRLGEGTAIWTAPTAPTGHEYVSEPHDYRDSSPFSDSSSEPPDEPTDIPADVDIGTDYEPPPDDDREHPSAADYEFSDIAEYEYPSSPAVNLRVGGSRTRSGKHHQIRNTPCPELHSA